MHVPVKFKTICVPNKMNLILQMPQSTYDEIVDTLTTRNGFQPTEHQIVTYYYERFQK